MLIALLDPAHVLHDVAHAWFEREGRVGWATCPLTQNGVLRIVGSLKYPGLAGGPAAVAPLLARMIRSAGHEFWPDNVTLLDPARADTSRLLTSTRITDAYLLALAVAHKGRLATLDAHLNPDGIRGGAAALHRIESPS